MEIVHDCVRHVHVERQVPGAQANAEGGYMVLLIGRAQQG
jgi:hypothetical protein